MNRITFQSKTSVSDSAGGFVNTLVDYYTCWAEIARDSESKTNIVEKDSINADITFRIRYTTSKVFDNKLVISLFPNLTAYEKCRCGNLLKSVDRVLRKEPQRLD